MISGQNFSGVTLGATATAVTLQGNLIGLNEAGTGVMANSSYGVWILGSGNTIGGSSAGARNVISANGLLGIRLSGADATGNTIAGNYIGTGTGGTTDMGNGEDGIQLDTGASNNIDRRHQSPSARNVIGGNNNAWHRARRRGDHRQHHPRQLDRRRRERQHAGGQQPQRHPRERRHRHADRRRHGRRPQRDRRQQSCAASASPMPAARRSRATGSSTTRWDGIVLNGTTPGTVIGDTTGTGGNLIAHNSSDGILVWDSTSSATILANSIYANGQRGIDLADNGYDTNDLGDTDTGANDRQNFPALSSASAGTAGTTVVGALNSTANTTFRIDIYTNRPGDVDGSHGEGARWVGSFTITTDGSGNANFNNLLANGWINQGDLVTATATVDLGGGSYGATSEFASNITGTASGVVVVDTASETYDSGVASGTVTIATLGANRGGDGRISLREAVFAVDNTANGVAADRIVFAIAPNIESLNYNTAALPPTITLTSALTTINQAVNIDASTQTGYAGTPLVQISGGGTVAQAFDLNTGSTGSTVRGFILSSFTQYGVYANVSNSHTIAGNWIGLARDGVTGTSSGNGVYLANSTGSTIGGTTAADRNVISGNAERGIVLDNTHNTSVLGNYIGTDVTGLLDVNGSGANTLQSGVIVINGSSGNQIGSTTAGARNILSGNDHYGVELMSGSFNNTVAGNYIGTTVTGLAALGNSNGGASFWGAGTGNLVGGNVVAGNNGFGVLVGLATSGALIQGNYVGLGVDGSTALGNLATGILVSGGSVNTLIGTNADGSNDVAETNVIGANQDGILVVDPGTSGTLIQGNLIGTDASGLLARGNTFDGVRIAFGATANVVGGTNTLHRNVTAGNGQDGVQIADEASDGNTVRGNWIGINAAGTATLGNGGDGIFVSGGADNTVIGGTGANDGNWVAGNAIVGVEVDGASTGTVIQGNRIGTNLDGSANWGHGQNGVLMENGASGTLVGGTSASAANIIAFSGQGGVWDDGIAVSGASSTGNTFLGNSIYGSVGLGVDLVNDGVTANDAGDTDTDANNLQNFPVLATARTNASNQINLSGTLNGTANSFYRIEFFANASQDASLHGEGQTYLGFANVATDASGNASIHTALTANVALGSFISATATRSDAAYSTFTDTSEFAATIAAATMSPEDLVMIPGVAAGNVIGYYGFSDASALGRDDAVGTPITLSGNPVQTAGRDGSGALDLAGGVSGQYGDIVGITTGGAMTISATVRFDSTGDWQRVFDFGEPGSVGVGNIYVGRVFNTDDLTFTIEQDIGGGNLVTHRATAAGAIVNGQWMSVTATVDGTGQMALYIDGTLAASQAGMVLDPAVRSHNYVGRSAFGGDAPFDGAIDNLLVTQGALSASQVMALYQQSGGLSVPEGSASGTVIGTVVSLDPDADHTATYTLTDDAGGRFAIDPVTGTVTVANGALLDFESASSHAITVRSTNDDSLWREEVYTVALTDVNDAPAGSDGTVTATEDTPFTFTVAHFGFSDADGDALQRVVVTTLPAPGTLRLNGSAVTAGDAVTAADITLGRLTYTPPANAAGSAFASFTFQVQDDGGTALGGSDLDATANTLTIDVTAVNDVPVNSVPATLTFVEDAPTAITGLSIADPDAGTDILRTELTVTGGTLSATSGGGVVASGSGTGALVLTGTLADLNAFLAGASAPIFTGAANFNGTVTLEMVTSDGRNSGTGGVVAPGSFDYRFHDGAPAGSEPNNIPTTGGVTGVATNFSSGALATALTGSNTSFGVIYTGAVEITTAGTYTFSANADDAARVFVDGNPVLLAFFGTGNGTLALAAGRHTLEIRHAQDSGGSGLSVTISGPDTGNVATSVLAVPGVGRLVSTTASTAITLTAANDAPVNQLPGLQVTAVDTPLVLSVANGHAIRVGDVDAGASPLQVTLTATHGTLTLAGTAGLAFTTGDGSADASMVFSGSVTAINAALDGLVFTPAGGYNGSASITISTDDLGNTGSGGALTDTDVLNLQVGAARFQQGVAGYAGTQDTWVGAGAPATDHGADASVVADDNSASDAALLRFDSLFGNGPGQVPFGSTITGATLSVHVTDADAADLIALHRMLGAWTEASTYTTLGSGVQADGVEAAPGIDLTFDSGVTGWNNLSSAAITATVQAWANGATNNGWAFVSNNADVWTFASSENATVSLRPYLSIAFTPPQAPVLVTSGGAATFTENGSAVAVDAGLVLSDADSTQLSGATVRITGNHVPTQDVLAFADQNGITGSFASATGTLTLSGTATVAQYQAALRSVTYANTSEAPTAAVRTVEFNASDAFVTSGTATRNVGVVPVNDAPVITTTPGALNYNENAPASAVDPALTVADVDHTTLTGASVRISVAYANGEDVLGFTDQLGITGSWDATTGTLTLSGSASVADYQTALRSVSYRNLSEAPSILVRTVAFSVGDGSSSSAAATRWVQVVSVEDAPTTADAVASGSEDAASISITLGGSDVDGTVDRFRLIDLPANGTLYLDAGLTTQATVGTDLAATAQALTLYFVPTAELERQHRVPVCRP